MSNTHITQTCLRVAAGTQVFTNADTPEDAAEARRNGAEGIGLVRTEHMFFATDERLKAVRQMIMAETLQAPPRTVTPCDIIPHASASKGLRLA